MSKLNKSYTDFRLDYLCGAVFSILALILLIANTVLGVVAVFFGVATTIVVAIWESRRRTVSITYTFEGDAARPFKEIVSAFNNLASNRNVWVLTESRSIHDFHESKLNAGASNLINRSNIRIGEGDPPWVSTNIGVPVLMARKTTLYMMPDGILVYDDKGVGFVDYRDLSVSESTTRFIEEQPPTDATIVGRTWKYPNKKGGPDRRFKNNYEIPVCLYGELQIRSKSGLFLYLMTSSHDSPSKFGQEFGNILKMIEAGEESKQRQTDNPESASSDSRQDLKKKDGIEGSPPRRKVSAKAVLADINDGMDEAGLMQKYELSSNQLATVYRKLEQAGMMKKP